MRLQPLSLVLLALSLPVSAQTPCGLAGVTVTVTPENAAFGESVLVTLTNNSSGTIQLPTACTYASVHAGTSCGGPAVFTPFCAQVLTPIGPGQSNSMPWNQTDDNGLQVGPGTYAIAVRYFEGSVGTALTCCPLVDIAPGPGTAYCTTGSGSPVCPCGNQGDVGEGCENSSMDGAILGASGSAVLGADTVVLRARQCPGNIPGMFFSGPGELAGLPFGDGLRCVSGPIRRLGVFNTNSLGEAQSQGTLSLIEGLSAGDLRHYQYWFRDQVGPCNGGFNTTGAYRIQW